LLNFESLHQRLDLLPQQLRPHGVNLSLASENEPSASILKLLKEECEKTNAPYLAEHIGYLNTNPNGPSFGYLIAPPLNYETISNIVRNIQILHDFVGVPIALENCVVYSRHPESTMTWLEFITTLDQELPDNIGWLIDYAHLKVTNQNLKEGNFIEWLNVYALSKRPIFEVHFANVKFDSQGVCHDDHHEPFSDGFIRQTWSDFCDLGIEPFNLTIERELHSEKDIKLLLRDIKAVKNIFLETVGAVNILPFDDKTPAPEVCLQAPISSGTFLA
ncbi:MAG: DUF692 family multinuclear iron-containing protein, partial [Bdellovibrionota bacterium]